MHMIENNKSCKGKTEPIGPMNFTKDADLILN